MKDELFTLTQNILNQCCYFAKEHSAFYDSIKEINDYFLIRNDNYWQKVLDSTLLDENPLLAKAMSFFIKSGFDNEQEKILNNELIKINSQIPQLPLNGLDIQSNSLFSLFKLTILDKRLIDNNKNQLEEIGVLIENYESKYLPLSSFIVKFNFNTYDGILGNFDNEKFQINVNGKYISKSIFSHEYFHALDFLVLNQIYSDLQEPPKDLFLSHIDLSKNQLHQKEQHLINQLQFLHQKPIHTQINESYLSDLKLYFKYYLNYEIKSNQTTFGSFDIIELMDELVPSEKIPSTKEIFNNGKTEYLSRYSEKDDLIKILEKSLIQVPEQSLYSLFSQIRNLTCEIDYDYFSLPSEKLARIYQTQFEVLDNELCEKGYKNNKKVIPLGKEREVLTEKINLLVEQNFMPYLQSNIQNKIAAKTKNNFFFDHNKIFIHRKNNLSLNPQQLKL
jgi:hypothetical protein